MHARRLVVPLLAAAALLGLSTASAAANAVPRSVLYTSTQPGAPNLPSLGVEAYGFNQIGDEVLLRRVAKIKSVTVTMSDWACQSGAWYSGDCVSTAGATFPTPITLNIYKASTTDSGTGEVTPGGLLADGHEDVCDPVPAVGQPSLHRGTGGRVVQERPGLLQRPRPQHHVHAVGAEDEAAEGRGLGSLVQLRQLRPEPARPDELAAGLAERRARAQGARRPSALSGRALLGHAVRRQQLRRAVRHRRLQPGQCRQLLDRVSSRPCSSTRRASWAHASVPAPPREGRGVRSYGASRSAR